jgi:hypothetical protein
VRRERGERVHVRERRRETDGTDLAELERSEASSSTLRSSEAVERARGPALAAAERARGSVFAAAERACGLPVEEAETAHRPAVDAAETAGGGRRRGGCSARRLAARQFVSRTA